MSKLTVEIDIRELIERLPLPEKLRLVRELEKATWAKRLDGIVNKIRSQIKRLPSEEEINHLSNRARKKVYAKYKGSH